MTTSIESTIKISRELRLDILSAKTSTPPKILYGEDARKFIEDKIYTALNQFSFLLNENRYSWSMTEKNFNKMISHVYEHTGYKFEETSGVKVSRNMVFINNDYIIFGDFEFIFYHGWWKHSENRA